MIITDGEWAELLQLRASDRVLREQVATHETREARVRALADDWADEGGGLGASAALSDVANELRRALDGDA